jgi:hypothetical protein
MKYFIILINIFLIGCATTYQSGSGSSTGGYFEERIAEDNYLVYFKGNGYTTDKQAYEYALLRALEIGSELDYKYMFIQSSDSRAKNTTTNINLPTYSTTTGSVGGNNIYASTITNTPTAINVRKPRYYLNVFYFYVLPQGKFLKNTLLEIKSELNKLRLNIEEDENNQGGLKKIKTRSPGLPPLR